MGVVVVKRRDGQAMVEFALVAGILLFLLIGVLEGGLLTFVIGSARYATGAAAKVGSEAGNTAQADQDILGTLRQSSLGTTSLAAVTEVDIFKVDYDSSSGNLTPDPVDVNRYTLAGACLNCTPNPPWPASTRQVGGSPDFLGVTIKYGYTWKSGVLLAAHPLALQETYWMRLEPQSY